MPQKKKYYFRHKVSEVIQPICIEIYGDKWVAMGFLSSFVNNVNDWELI